MEDILEKGLVSIIIPCYNGASYLMRLMDAICLQTYRKIQVIFVNDGSTDETQKVFNLYRNQFKSRGIKNVYIYQENQGQASALNVALKYVKGEYLMWLDADDYITNNHVERKVGSLCKNQECNIVRCQGVIVEDSKITHIKGYLGKQPAIGTLFEDLLFGLRECSNGLYMVRTKPLFDVLTDREIYVSKAGQNFQLLLPLTYLNKICYLEESLFYYVERKESHSHIYDGIYDWRIRLDAVKDVKLHVLYEMRKMFSQKYMKFILKQFKILDTFERINKIIDYDYNEGEKEYIYSTIRNLFQDIRQKSQTDRYWIWGLCKKSERLVFYVETILGITIEGYIDSDKEKQREDRAINPEKIDASNMYILIFLEYHQDIIDSLYSHGFVYGTNYIYPKYELIRNLKDRKCEWLI